MKPLHSDKLAPQDEAWDEALCGVKKLPTVEIPPQAPLIIEEIIPSINYQRAYSGERLSALSVGETANIDANTAERFKRGEFKIERRLDLHGMTEKEAYEEVENFIKKSYQTKLRCVLIVTGKGTKRETDDLFSAKGIIKERVPQWLNSPEIRPLILSFAYALPIDGGDGALYVLLRRQRL